MASTGIRVAELCAIEVGDIDLQSARIRIHGKGSRERIVYVMNADVSGAIRLVLVCRDKVKGMQNSSLLVEPSGGLVAPQHFASCYMAWCGVQVCVGA
jgi:integrase/recombinase XerD